MANFKLLGKGANCGKLQISIKLNDDTSFILINQSVTGAFERKVDLLKV